MEKVVLPKEVAEAIDVLRDKAWSNHQILRQIEGTDINTYVIRLVGYVKLYGFDNLLQALVNGFEVEETPEDKIRYAYKQYHDTAISKEKEDDKEFCKGAVEGIIFALTALNIKIDGVNSNG